MPIFIAILSAIIYHNLYHNTAFTGDNKRQALYPQGKRRKEKLFVEKSQEDDQPNTKSLHKAIFIQRAPADPLGHLSSGGTAAVLIQTSAWAQQS